MGDVSHSIFSRGFDPDLVSGQLPPQDRNPAILVNFNYIDLFYEKLCKFFWSNFFFELRIRIFHQDINPAVP